MIPYSRGKRSLIIDPRLSGETSFALVFFVFKFLFVTKRPRNLDEFAILSECHVALEGDWPYLE